MNETYQFDALTHAVDFALRGLMQSFAAKERETAKGLIRIALPAGKEPCTLVAWPQGGKCRIDPMEHGGVAAPPEGLPRTWIALSELHKQPLRCMHNPHAEQGERVLVLCGAMTAGEMREFLDDLGRSQRAAVIFHKLVWKAAGDGHAQQRPFARAYELRGENGSPVAIPCGIRHHSAMLVYRGSCGIWMPAGWSHPLDKADFRQLFPRPGVGEHLIWLADGGLSPVYKGIALDEEDPVFLASHVVLTGDAGDIDRGIEATSRPAPPRLDLQLRPRGRRADLGLSGEVVYRVRTSGGSVGQDLLRMLDGCDARLEELRYSARLDGDGCYAPVDHYFLGDAEIFQDDDWPEIARFDLPLAMESLGLPIYIRSDLQFSPDIGVLLAGLGPKDEFVGKLAKACGLEESAQDWKKTHVLIDLPEGCAGPWRIVHLNEMRPLRACIDMILPQCAREDIERTSGQIGMQLEESRQRCEERWMRLADAENQELLAVTRTWADEMELALKSLEEEASLVEMSVEQSAEVVAFVRKMTLRTPPRIEAFLDAVKRQLDALAEPRRQWIAQALRLAERAENLQRNAGVLLDELEKRATEVIQGVETRQRTLDERLTALHTREAAARATLTRLETDTQAALDEVERLPKALKEWAERIGDAEKLIKTKEDKTDHLRRELRERQKELASRRQKVERDEQELNKWDITLKADVSVLEARRAKADSEVARLTEIRDVDLPRLGKQIVGAEALLAGLRIDQIDDQRMELEKRLAECERQVQDAESAGEHLKQLEGELAQLENELKAQETATNVRPFAIRRKYEDLAQRLSMFGERVPKTMWQRLFGNWLRRKA